MVKWPGVIEPGTAEGMFSIMDFLPTFAAVLGMDLPTDRPIDGVDQTDYVNGSQDRSNRDRLITFIGDRLAAVRWNQWRIYPTNFTRSDNNPSLGGYLGYMNETAGYPMIFNIEADQKRETGSHGRELVDLGGLFEDHRRVHGLTRGPPEPASSQPHQVLTALQSTAHIRQYASACLSPPPCTVRPSDASLIARLRPFRLAFSVTLSRRPTVSRNPPKPSDPGDGNSSSSGISEGQFRRREERAG